MPREAPNLPRDTHGRLLAGRGANGHMPVVGHEVATFPRRSLARRLGMMALEGVAVSVLVVGVVIIVAVTR